MSRTVLTATDIEVLHALAENNMSTAGTARAIHMNRANIYYHINMIRDVTGLDPLKFYDMCWLLTAYPEEKRDLNLERLAARRRRKEVTA